MPPDGINLMGHQDILSYEEISTVARAAAELGINKIRLTGGEPLVRLGLSDLIERLVQFPGIDDVSLTTNGVLLSQYAQELKRVGLHRVNISLDTLKADRFVKITGSDKLADVLAGIEAARHAGLRPVKINTVVIAGVNDDELIDFSRKTATDGWHVRFIELMHTAGISGLETGFISARNMKQRLDVLGKLEPCRISTGNGPAEYYRLPGATGTIGFITPVSEHFCSHCNRLRLTSNGKLRPCLLSEEEIDLKEPLRRGISFDGLKKLIEAAAAKKPQQHRLSEGLSPRHHPMFQVGG